MFFNFLFPQLAINEIERLNIPGASLAIVKGDQAEYIQGYGVSNPDGTKMTSQTPIVLGSTTKSFTSLAIMQLVEQGIHPILVQK
ncbi:serine hydrolase [Bacillus nitratireducens]|uniref:serine hydrolase n=1 Tax=Bacillus nitratireducens TaxID=2026193 RepID=UPI0039BF49CA